MFDGGPELKRARSHESATAAISSTDQMISHARRQSRKEITIYPLNPLQREVVQPIWELESERKTEIPADMVFSHAYPALA